MDVNTHASTIELASIYMDTCSCVACGAAISSSRVVIVSTTFIPALIMAQSCAKQQRLPLLPNYSLFPAGEGNILQLDTPGGTHVPSLQQPLQVHPLHCLPQMPPASCLCSNQAAPSRDYGMEHVQPPPILQELNL
jgi:hypothetical protein